MFHLSAEERRQLLALERPSFHAITQCWFPILYTGFFPAAKDANPTLVSLMLSLGSVFAALGGAVLRHERMGGDEAIGGVLMLAAIRLAQFPASIGASEKSASTGENHPDR